MEEHKQHLGTILAIDDVPENLDLLATLLTRAGYAVRTTTSGAFALQAAHATPPDLILLDVRMPDMDGFAVCRQLKKDLALSAIPVIFISALHDIEDKVKAFEAGGVDYLTKPFHEAEVLARVKTHHSLFRMQTRLEELVAERSADLIARTRALEAEIGEREKVEAELREAAFRYRTVADFTYAWEYWESPDGSFRYISPSCARVSGYPAEAFTADPGLLSRIVAEEDRPSWEAHRREATCGGCPHKLEFRIRAADGTLRWLDHTCQPVTDAEGGFLGFRGSNRDISENKELEKALRQAQKMEAIGILAGGIAHDFNNILTPILMRAEMALLAVPAGGELDHDIHQIIQAAERARNLVSQILDYSRQGRHEPVTTRLGPIVKEGVKFLRAATPANIELTVRIATEDDAVLADPTQMLQVLMNLVVNAVHAMEGSSGSVTVSLDDAEPEPGQALDEGKEWLRLEVRDSGRGIAPELLDRIFEPYFTTKVKGDGTGMGLAVVHGIVVNHHGTIRVQSEPGKGAIFTVLLPKCRTSSGLSAVVADLPLEGRGEHLLLVDDETAIIDSARRILEQFGYKVTALTDSAEALAAFTVAPEAFDLVLTDQTMPKMTGKALAAELLRVRPNLPVVLCTGFSEEIDQEKAEEMGIAAFIFKPFSLNQLTSTIRRVLDEATGKREH
ncbi:MAG: response regulator [Desulfurivibrionaceae bacterium]